ncbi:MAG: LiaI-LiaF-like domain-containing protein [Sphingobacteriales bacterium]
MKTIIEDSRKTQRSRTILGAFVVVIGTILLVDQLNVVLIPDWLFSWPMILILIGLYSGAKHNFQNLGWLVWIFIGGAFLADDAFPGMNIGYFAWPIGLILLGGYFITRRSFQHRI